MRNFRFYLVVSFFLLLLAFLSTALSAQNFYLNPELRAPFNIFRYAVIPFLAVPLLIFTVLSLKHNYPFTKWTHSLQVLILLIMSGFAILDDFDNSYGVAMLLMAVLLLYAYKQMDLLRVVLTGLYIIIITVIGAYLEGSVQYSILTIFFDLFFLVTIAMFNYENTKKVSARNKNLQMVIHELKSELMDKEKIESKITAIQLDVDEFSFTQAEREILSLMCEKGLTSNKDLADNLNKSESTVKSQLHSIYGKTGIRKRSRLIAFFRE